MIWPFLILVGLVVCYWLTWRYKNRRLLDMGEKIPGPPTLPILGNAMYFMCSPEELIIKMKNLTTEYGDLLRFWLGPDLCIIVSNPDDIRTLLANPKTSIKGPQYKYMADVIGEGILSGGPAWRKHRKIATPNYGKRAIESYEEVFNRETSKLMKVFRAQPPMRQFNIYKEIVRTTSYSVCQTLMGLTLEETLKINHLHDIIDETPRVYDVVFDRMTKWYLQIDPIFWMTNAYKHQKSYMSKIMKFAKDIIEFRLERLKTFEDKADLMNTDEDHTTNTQLSVIDRFILSQGLDSEELINETFTIFTSSQEASAKISSALIVMMAYHPNCQDKLYNEIKAIMGDADRDVKDEDLKQMPYLDMVFKEVLRLYPIGSLLQRTVSDDIVLDSGVLPKGCSLVIPIHHLHRDPRFWDNPEAFDPERFNPANAKSFYPNSYIPFSLGPMDCLGRYFGIKLVKTICVRVLREFEVSSFDSYKDLRLSIAISTALLNGYNAFLKPRNKQI